MAIRVLLADDHALIRAGVRLLLEDECDIEIVGEAAGGREALAMARELGPDVVLMDIKMPDGDGIETTQAIRRLCPQAQVLVLTAYSDPELVQHAATAGAAGYVLKDISAANLVAAIRAVHNGSTMVDPGVVPGLLECFATAGTEGRRGPHGLTEREAAILREVVGGLGDKEVAAKLFLSVSTVKADLRAIYRRLKVRNRAQAAAFTISRRANR